MVLNQYFLINKAVHIVQDNNSQLEKENYLLFYVLCVNVHQIARK